MKNLEFKNLVNDSEKLAKVNDLWYFVKSKSHRWIVGSGH
ncbi:YydF family exported signaling peptide [Staphylococcus condimenti]|uniref:Epipeptide YydF family RiPP n=2 Tax=Staphylococcus condimenti TaxID=70255 RepID=A0A143PE20_9STAP|nr:epipeptide YydF family RiPP [Staphylococcus condimenti]OFP04109.1 signaling protein [Staphylococcus sp. HMSC065E08]AMY06797.1 signaling protein [Staphylococcus condimenti]APR62123.1 signaling protein [Staphylococcus condimenti]PNZ56402.1 YydF family exported signaling peptide [Staphylococcus condimenti]QQS84064.1 epipeptide YydF family RiPP [Staphylococcus condimenti]